jgi:lauroyl/myristoyl acyltransferase
MKKRDNHREYLEVLRSMTSAQRARIAFDLGERNKRLLKQALRKRFPELSDEELHQLFLERLAKCHNQNW